MGLRSSKYAINYYEIERNIPEFINLYCELDHKNKMPIAEFIAAFYEYMTKIKKQKIIASMEDILCSIKFIMETRYPMAMSIYGPRTIDEPFQFLYICGARLRYFPSVS